MPRIPRTGRAALALLACVAVVGVWWWASAGGPAGSSHTSPSATAGPRQGAGGADGAGGATVRPAPTTGIAARVQTQQPDRTVGALVLESALPPGARHTIELIHRGGPFPYSRDGVVFGNREGLLPSQPSGYYREYTVTTPGQPDRGARRIITGREGAMYYTDDHYASFRLVVEGR